MNNSRSARTVCVLLLRNDESQTCFINWWRCYSEWPWIIFEGHFSSYTSLQGQCQMKCSKWPTSSEILLSKSSSSVQHIVASFAYGLHESSTFLLSKSSWRTASTHQLLWANWCLITLYICFFFDNLYSSRMGEATENTFSIQLKQQITYLNLG